MACQAHLLHTCTYPASHVLDINTTQFIYIKTYCASTDI